MKLLEQQQEREEKELLERGPSAANADLAAPDAARSRSGNDLVAFAAPEGGEGRERRRADYANAKSMPGSRRHSGELQADGVVGEARRAKGVAGEGPMLNSFLFDDELDADLQSMSLLLLPHVPLARPPSGADPALDSAWGGKYLQMNTDDDKFPILVRRDSYPGIVRAALEFLDNC